MNKQALVRNVIKKLALDKDWLKNFKTSTIPMWVNTAFGGGHTPETDPTKKGWQIKYYPGGQGVALLGNKKYAICFSIVETESGKLDVAEYSEYPAKIHQALKENNKIPYEGIYKEFKDHSGWALPIISGVEKTFKE